MAMNFLVSTGTKPVQPACRIQRTDGPLPVGTLSDDPSLRLQKTDVLFPHWLASMFQNVSWFLLIVWGGVELGERSINGLHFSSPYPVDYVIRNFK